MRMPLSRGNIEVGFSRCVNQFANKADSIMDLFQNKWMSTRLWAEAYVVPADEPTAIIFRIED